PSDVYTLSLPDALPILNVPSWQRTSWCVLKAQTSSATAAVRATNHRGVKRIISGMRGNRQALRKAGPTPHLSDALRRPARNAAGDRKSTRLNSSHVKIS